MFFQIGDRGSAGGIVFYLTDATGKHGLEAAPVDQGVAEWGCEGTEIAGADGIEVDTGAQNTVDILAGCNTGRIAAQIADAYSHDGFDDWFLPSKDELMAINKLIGPAVPPPPPLTNVDRLNYGFYWSSTEGSSVSAFALNTIEKMGENFSKSNQFAIRSIRAF